MVVPEWITSTATEERQEFVQQLFGAMSCAVLTLEAQLGLWTQMQEPLDLQFARNFSIYW